MIYDSSIDKRFMSYITVDKSNDVAFPGTFKNTTASGVIAHADEIKDEYFKENSVDSNSVEQYAGDGFQSDINKFLWEKIKAKQNASASGFDYKGAVIKTNASTLFAVGATYESGDTFKVGKDCESLTIFGQQVQEGDTIIFNKAWTIKSANGAHADDIAAVDYYSFELDGSGYVQKQTDAKWNANGFLVCDADGKVTSVAKVPTSASTKGDSDHIPCITTDQYGRVVSMINQPLNAMKPLDYKEAKAYGAADGYAAIVETDANGQIISVREKTVTAPQVQAMTVSEVQNLVGMVVNDYKDEIANGTQVAAEKKN